jgi:hypothetical protein
MTPEQLEQEISRVTNGEYVQFILPIVERYTEGRVREVLKELEKEIFRSPSSSFEIIRAYHVTERLEALDPPSPKESETE